MSRTRWRSSLTAVLTLLLLAVLPVPANAGPGRDGPPGADILPGGYNRFCWLVVSYVRPSWLECIEIPVPVQWWPEPECPQCGLEFLWRHDRYIHPEVARRFNEQVAYGLNALGNAGIATDPARRDRLKADALNAFTDAARTSASFQVSLESAGVGDPARVAYRPRPDLPWLAASGADVAVGIEMVKRSGPSREAAAQFDKAYKKFSEQQVVAG